MGSYGLGVIADFYFGAFVLEGRSSKIAAHILAIQLSRILRVVGGIALLSWCLWLLGMLIL